MKTLNEEYGDENNVFDAFCNKNVLIEIDWEIWPKNCYFSVNLNSQHPKIVVSDFGICPQNRKCLVEQHLLRNHLLS